MRRHIIFLAMAMSVFFLFLAPLEANQLCLVNTAGINLPIGYKIPVISIADFARKIETACMSLFQSPSVFFKLEAVTYRAIENIKQIEQSI